MRSFAISTIILFQSQLLAVNAAETNISEQLRAEIIANYTRHHRDVPTALYVETYLNRFEQIKAEALRYENSKAAIQYGEAKATTTIDFGPRTAIGVLGIGATVDVGAGATASPTHWRFLARTGLGVGEADAYNFSLGIQGQSSRPLRLPYLNIDLQASSVQPDRTELESRRRSSETVGVPPIDTTDDSMFIGHSAKIYNGSPLNGRSNSAIQLGIGGFNEKRRLDLFATLPVYIPRITALNLKFYQASLEQAILALQHADLKAADGYLNSAMSFGQILRTYDHISKLNLKQITELPAGHPVASIENVLNDRSIKPLPAFRACVSFMASFVTGKL